MKFGWSSALENVDYFFKIPRTLMEAEAEGWRRTNREGLMAELRMYCTPGTNVCPLYDVGGFVAGLQIGVSITLKFNKLANESIFADLNIVNLFFFSNKPFSIASNNVCLKTKQVYAI